MNVEQLEGRWLDYWVGKAENINPRWLRELTQRDLLPYAYSSQWQVGGPVMERLRFNIGTATLDRFVVWRHDCERTYGDTMLQAAMRAYVRMTFGDEISDGS